MILVKSRDCLAARSTASCSARLMCARIHRKANEDEGKDKECRRMSMRCTIELGEWGSCMTSREKRKSERRRNLCGGGRPYFGLPREIF